MIRHHFTGPLVATIVLLGAGALLDAQRAMPPGPTCVVPQDGKGCLPVAPAAKRVDLRTPSFSNPTSITNPLHPSSRLTQVIYAGQVNGEPWRTEFTRLPDSKAIEWDGQKINVVTWQYLAYANGRIDEVALDWFAQADDGAVWYLGEDVFNYKDGVVADTEGTWIAGKNGPPGMIMPGSPKVGDVYRPENSPDIVFEEVMVTAVGQTVQGPGGPLTGAIVVTELHRDGVRENKIFAPGYGEFSTGSPTADLEEAAFAVPTDARSDAAPASFGSLSTAVRNVFDTAASGNWSAAAGARTALTVAWNSYRSTGVSALLVNQMNRDVAALDAAVSKRDASGVRHAALRIAQNELDLRLRYFTVAAVDLARVELWGRQAVIDAAAKHAADAAGDIAALDWTWRRARQTLDRTIADRVDTQVGNLRRAAEKKDLAALVQGIPAVLQLLSSASGSR